MLLSPCHATADDHLQDEVVSASGQTNADSEVEFPLGRDIQIDGREDLVLLFARRIKTANRADGAVVFNSAIDLLGERIGDFDVRSEFEPTFGAGSLQGALEDGD